jgi:hypothetical protein
MQREHCLGQAVRAAKESIMQKRDSGSWGKPKSRETIGGRRAAMRVLQAGMRMVIVYEQEPSATDQTRALVFESGDSIVRLTQYPADWRKLPDDQLLTLPKAQA